MLEAGNEHRATPLATDPVGVRYQASNDGISHFPSYPFSFRVLDLLIRIANNRGRPTPDRLLSPPPAWPQGGIRRPQERLCRAESHETAVYVRVVLQRCAELYREGGVSELTRGIRDYVKHDLGEDYRDRRVDNDARWAFISSHVDEDDRSLIDVGCAEGEFAARAAERGLDVVGFDRNVTRLHTAKTEHSGMDNLRFERLELDPETIGELPEADVILFLTVHHHWVKAYGWDDATEMFRTLLRKGDTVIYEPPGHLPIREAVEGDLDPDESVDYYTELLESTFSDEISIVDVTQTEYMDGSDRRDPIFVLDSSDY